MLDALDLDRYESLLMQMPEKLLLFEWITVRYHVKTRDDEYVDIWRKMKNIVERVADQRNIDLKVMEKTLPQDLMKLLSNRG